jgi:hypothetical protein
MASNAPAMSLSDVMNLLMDTVRRESAERTARSLAPLMIEIASLERERNSWRAKSALADMERDCYKEKYDGAQNKMDALEQMQKAVEAAVNSPLYTRG